MAANLSAPADVLAELALVETLAGDRLDWIAHAARKRLGLDPRPMPGIPVTSRFRADPRTGRIR
ncbi:hypothetical protein [Arthrobacter mobilis]|uniref:Uncharacterized protein n=1 Tax=Arthrobacter mobilis TaxID=2724944 RepID=A0A7X6K812_9MICC|nr:hypothetical protein [Arthrobacter mobilis]NKX56833.1 hypothetical protein [Arthrobacter mobilis]